ncbi:DUF3667 domain-containing protein [Flavobacterium sp.]
MSKNIGRKDKTCLNCNYVVENKFCSNCGQENVDTRKTFHHLFVHFFEDLTHYENSFWKTIRNLIFHPASLTKEYLSGKRMSYLAPIRLYIFISFITFFLINVIPNGEQHSYDDQHTKKSASIVKTEKDTIFKEQKRIIELEKEGIFSKAESDSLQTMIVEVKNNQLKKKTNDFFVIGESYESTKALDSIQSYGKPSEKLGSIEYWITRKIQLIHDKYDSDTVQEKFIESFDHNLPKSLFIYMPLFAFVLWLFQNKKRWYYFDHGIFTLHYFSFLLLGLLILKISHYLFGFLSDYYIFTIVEYIFISATILYMLYYFFPAHHRFYGESRTSTILKGIVIFCINLVSILLILIIMGFYTFITIH